MNRVALRDVVLRLRDWEGTSWHQRATAQRPASPVRLQRSRAIVAGALAFISILFVKDAWLSDDAYITFRTVSNFVAGYGPTWNVDERVQSFTHPLWMFLLSSAYFIVRDIYWSSLALSLIMSVVAVGLLAFRIARTSFMAKFSILLLAASKTLLDYATSGLEDSATYLFLALFMLVYIRYLGKKRYLLLLALIAALAAFNRMDSLLLLLPALLYVSAEMIWKSVRGCVGSAGGVGGRAETSRLQVEVARCALTSMWVVTRTLVVGFAPFLAWEVFSLWYYGFPFPNTAYAKIDTGIPHARMLMQGWFYLISSLQFDPILFVGIGAALFLAVASRRGRNVALALGILLYMLYVVWVGGDFMAGRFLAGPFFLAVLLIASVPLPAAWLHALRRVQLPARLPRKVPHVALQLGAMGVVLAFALLTPHSRWYREGLVAVPIDAHGVTDERTHYLDATGIAQIGFGPTIPKRNWAQQGLEARDSGQRVVTVASVGFYGYEAGPRVHIVDTLALCDPLLARLPSSLTWRIGHFSRAVPDGYLATLESGHNQIADPDLALYYSKLQIVTRGNLFDPHRLVEIWKINTGQYDYLLAAYKEAHPPQ